MFIKVGKHNCVASLTMTSMYILFTKEHDHVQFISGLIYKLYFTTCKMNVNARSVAALGAKMALVKHPGNLCTPQGR
jgi:hypothetical protein